MTDKSAIKFYSCKLNRNKIHQINEELHAVDWNGVLNSEDCNENFNVFCNILHKSVNKVVPLQHVRISGKRRYTEPWMTTGIKTSTSKSLRLYKKTLSKNCTIEDTNKYKSHRNLLNRVKRHAKQTYYISKCNEYKKNTQKLWQVINQMISRRKHRGSLISCISIDGIKTYDPQTISNTFGSFYANLGSNLAKQIKPWKMEINEYINAIPHTLNSLALTPMNQQEINKIIANLPNKSSSRHDRINNILLKQLSSSISYLLMIIFNQSISTGTFPDLMQLAEVILLYKGKEKIW